LPLSLFWSPPLSDLANFLLPAQVPIFLCARPFPLASALAHTGSVDKAATFVADDARRQDELATGKLVRRPACSVDEGRCIEAISSGLIN